MAKNEKVDVAFELYKSGNSPQEIADKLEMSVNTIKTWKRRYNWDGQRVAEGKQHKKKGPPFGSKNALGHKRSVPYGNQNARKHGLYCKKHLPEETAQIMKELLDADPLDLLWNQIVIQYTAIVRSQKLMYVADQNDSTKVTQSEGDFDNGYSRSYDIQYAWDKHANYMKALSTAQNSLKSLIKQYDDMLHANWDLATEEQKARIENLKARTQTNEKEEMEDDGFIEALNSSAAEDWKDESTSL